MGLNGSFGVFRILRQDVAEFERFLARHLSGKVVQKLAGDMQAARVHEVIRQFRGCRTLDELADVTLWIRNNRNLFEQDSLTKLRAWYAHFKAEVIKEQLEELQRKYGGGEVVAK